MPPTAEVWGTVSDWVSAIVTGGAFMIAALVYMRDSNLSRRAQAKLILPRLVGNAVGDEVRVLVENYSTNSVFHLQIELRRIDLWKAVLSDSSETFMISPDPSKKAVREIVDKTANEYEKAPYRKAFEPADAERLVAGSSFDFHIDRTTPYQGIFLTFIDSKGRSWEVGDIATHRPELRKRKNASNRRHWLSAMFYRLRHPLRAVKEFRARLKGSWRSLGIQIRIMLTEMIIDAVKEKFKDEEFKKKISDAVAGSVVRAIVAKRQNSQDTKQGDSPDNSTKRGENQESD